MTVTSKLLKVARIREPGTPPGTPARLLLRCPCGARPVAEGQVIECACGALYHRDGTVVEPCTRCGGPVNPNAGTITVIPWHCTACTPQEGA